MSVLKAEIFAETFLKRGISYDQLDIKKVIITMHSMHDSCSSKYKLYNNNYGRTVYQGLPRCIRYNFSEKQVDELRYEPKYFYDYNESTEFILMEYCNVILDFLPGHKKTLRIIKTLKSTHPELFI